MEFIWVLTVDGDVEYHRTFASALHEIGIYDGRDVECIVLECHALNDNTPTS